jgi:hypothetical protein
MLSYRWDTLLLLSCAALALLAAPPAGSAAPPEECRSDVFHCVEETMGIDLDVEVQELPDHVAFGTRLVIYYWDGDCKYRQVVVVRVLDLPQLQDIVRLLGANEWNAMGELSRDEYRAALAGGTLLELFTEPPEVEACKADPGLPPCELPGEPIVIEVVDAPEDILMMSSFEPVKNPKFCFSADLERGPIIDPVPDIAVPFFFFDAKDTQRIVELLNRR